MNINDSLQSKLKAGYITAVSRLLFALIRFAYNAWRLEVSEDNNNLRTAAFALMDYEQIANGVIQHRFDLVVCNLAYLANNRSPNWLATIPTLLTDGSTFALQTLHPKTAGGDLAY